MEKTQKKWKKSVKTWKNDGKKERKRERKRGNKFEFTDYNFCHRIFFLNKCNFSRIFIRKRNRKTANIEIKYLKIIQKCEKFEKTSKERQKLHILKFFSAF
jgi:hypothetical protein